MLVTYEEESRSFAKIGMWVELASVTGIGDPEQVTSIAMMGDVLQALEVPLLGRWLEAGARFRARRVMMLTEHPHWQRRFGGDPNRRLSHDHGRCRSTEIVGVMRRKGFQVSTRRAGLLQADSVERARARAVSVLRQGVARLKPGVSTSRRTRISRALCRGSTDSHPNGGRCEGQIPRRLKITPRCGSSSRTSSATHRTLLWVVMGTIRVVRGSRVRQRDESAARAPRSAARSLRCAALPGAGGKS